MIIELPQVIMLAVTSGAIYGLGFWYTKTQAHVPFVTSGARILVFLAIAWCLLNLPVASSILMTLLFLITFWLTILKLESSYL